MPSSGIAIEAIICLLSLTNNEVGTLKVRTPCTQNCILNPQCSQTYSQYFFPSPLMLHGLLQYYFFSCSIYRQQVDNDFVCMSRTAQNCLWRDHFCLSPGPLLSLLQNIQGFMVFAAGGKHLDAYLSPLEDTVAFTCTFLQEERSFLLTYNLQR